MVGLRKKSGSKEEMNSTSFFAFYGAFVATANVAWNIYLYINERPQLKITGMIAWVIQGGVRQEKKEFFITITNLSKRPITISSVAGLNYDGSTIVSKPAMNECPKELFEGHQLKFTFGYADCINEKLKQIRVWDTKGKCWLFPEKELELLKHQNLIAVNQDK